MRISLKSVQHNAKQCCRDLELRSEGSTKIYDNGFGGVYESKTDELVC